MNAWVCLIAGGVGLAWGAAAQTQSPRLATLAAAPASASASASVPASPARLVLSPLVPAQGRAPAAPWRLIGLPQSTAAVPSTRFEIDTIAGERALKISTQASYGALLHELPRLAPSRLQWQWRLDQALGGGTSAADIRTRAGDDAALKVCVLFDHPLEQVPFTERTALRLARAISGEDLPAATLCYLWDSLYPAGTQGPNPYSRRVRFIVLQGQGAPLGQWQTQNRDVAADFAKLFADEVGAAARPSPVRSVIVGADSDNTGSRSLGWLRELSWVAAEGASASGR